MNWQGYEHQGAGQEYRAQSNPLPPSQVSGKLRWIEFGERQSQKAQVRHQNRASAQSDRQHVNCSNDGISPR
jgi:hypothetical protein